MRNGFGAWIWAAVWVGGASCAAQSSSPANSPAPHVVAPTPDLCESVIAAIVDARTARRWDEAEHAVTELAAKGCPGADDHVVQNREARRRHADQMRAEFPVVVGESGACTAWIGYRAGDAVPEHDCWTLQKVCRHPPSDPRSQEYARFGLELLANPAIASVSRETWINVQHCYGVSGDAPTLDRMTAEQAARWSEQGNAEALLACLDSCTLSATNRALLATLEAGRARVARLRSALAAVPNSLVAAKDAYALRKAELSLAKIDDDLAQLTPAHADHAELAAARTALEPQRSQARVRMRASDDQRVAATFAELRTLLDAHAKTPFAAAGFRVVSDGYEDSADSIVTDIATKLTLAEQLINGLAELGRETTELHKRLARDDARMQRQVVQRRARIAAASALAERMCNLTDADGNLPAARADLRQWRSLATKLRRMGFKPPEASACHMK